MRGRDVSTDPENGEATGWRSGLLWVVTFSVPVLIGLLILAAVIALLAWLVYMSGGV
jgi:hypothetical protein